jgi:HNH endonuclease/AP2 domain
VTRGTQQADSHYKNHSTIRHSRSALPATPTDDRVMAAAPAGAWCCGRTTTCCIFHNKTPARLDNFGSPDYRNAALVVLRSIRIRPPGRISAGNIAGAKKAGDYIRISIDGRQHLAHRLAWLYVHGRWPAALIDHINGNPADNRIANLREASRSQNQANSGLRLGNRSGLKGISRKPYGTWSAQIFYQGTKHYLGTFATPEEAHAAYREAARRLFGEFARMR